VVIARDLGKAHEQSGDGRFLEWVVFCSRRPSHVFTL
jgi:hypothetical protein